MAVSECRGDDKLPVSPHLHAHEPLVPALDDLSLSELERNVPRIKYFAIGKLEKQASACSICIIYQICCNLAYDTTFGYCQKVRTEAFSS